MWSLPLSRASGSGKKTASAGTAITLLIKPIRGLYSRLTSFLYTPGATPHTATAMLELSRGTTWLQAAASQAVVTLPADPGLGTAAGAAAANDVIIFEKSDRTFLVATIQSVGSANTDGSIPYTLAANLSAILPKGSKFWFLGAVGDGHPQYALAASTQANLTDAVIGFIGSEQAFSPVLISVDNVTAAGSLDRAAFGWYADAGITSATANAPMPEGAAEGETAECGDCDDGFDPESQKVQCAPAACAEGETPHWDVEKDRAAKAATKAKPAAKPKKK